MYLDVLVALGLSDLMSNVGLKFEDGSSSNQLPGMWPLHKNSNTRAIRQSILYIIFTLPAIIK